MKPRSSKCGLWKRSQLSCVAEQGTPDPARIFWASHLVCCLVQTLGYAAVRARHTVRFAPADRYFREMAQARVDRSIDKTVRSFLAPDLLLLDELGPHRLDQQQSIDLYEPVIARHRTASFVLTSNRAVEEWLGLFDGPILTGSALDRLANASYQIVIDGESDRQRLSSHRVLLEPKEVLGPPTAH